MAKISTAKQIEQYEHSGKEGTNNPYVGLVTPASDPDTGAKKTCHYDPHPDPQRQWTVKAEIDKKKVKAFKETLSFEFEPGNTIAIKIIDDCGIESLRVIKM